MKKQHFNIGKCAKCGKHREINKHHIAPKCFYGKDGQTVMLCLEHHKEIEMIYEFSEGVKIKKGHRNQLTELEYYKIFVRWLNGD